MADEPLFISPCSERLVGVFEVDLVCVLPEGHVRDGQTYHRSVDGSEWVRV